MLLWVGYFIYFKFTRVVVYLMFLDGTGTQDPSGTLAGPYKNLDPGPGTLLKPENWDPGP